MKCIKGIDDLIIDKLKWLTTKSYVLHNINLNILDGESYKEITREIELYKQG